MTRSFLVGAQLLLLFALFTLALAASTAQTAPAFYWDPRLDGLGITLQRADDCADGCWRLVSAVFEDETQSGGNHNIYYEAPRDPTLFGEVSNGQQTWTFPLDKLPPDPPGNFDMYRDNVYSARMHNAPSDVVRGMRMTGEHGGDHVNYRLTWQWTAGPPEVPTVTATVTVTPDGTPYFIPIVEVGDTSVPPEATRTPTATLTATPTVTTTPTNGMPFTGSIVQTFVNCGLTQVFGVVEDTNGTPISETWIRLTWDGGQLYAQAGDKPEFGPSGWDIVLGQERRANTWRVAVVDEMGNLLSPEVPVQTHSHCDAGAVNVAKLRFVRAP
ncbi:MAG TPA: hypothetical protein VF707_17955 [Ardenticatenaceae bacterium]|jgi:hypothetical protein